MKEKEICSYLDKKFNEFIEQFSEDIQTRLKKESYFAGGCIYSLWNDLEPKDFDLFCTNNNFTETLINLDKIWYYKTKYALTQGDFQIITKYYGEPNTCVKEFDFKHNMFYYVSGSGNIIGLVDKKYLGVKELFFNEQRPRDLAGVALRIDRFTNRGFTISDIEREKINSRVSLADIIEY